MGHCEAQVFKHGLCLVPEGDVVKNNVARKIRLCSSGVFLLIFSAGHQNLIKAGQRNAGLAHFGQRAPQRTHRPGQRLVIGYKDEKFAQRDAAAHGQKRAKDNDRKHLQAGHQVAQSPVRAQGVAQIDPLIGKGVVLFVKPVDLVPFAAKGAHHAHASQIFLHSDGQVTLGLVGVAKLPRDAAVVNAGIQHDNGNEDERHKRQSGVHGKHQRQRCGDENESAQHFDELIGDEVAHHIDV